MLPAISHNYNKGMTKTPVMTKAGRAQVQVELSIDLSVSTLFCYPTWNRQAIHEPWATVGMVYIQQLWNRWPCIPCHKLHFNNKFKLYLLSPACPIIILKINGLRYNNTCRQYAFEMYFIAHTHSMSCFRPGQQQYNSWYIIIVQCD